MTSQLEQLKNSKPAKKAIVEAPVAEASEEVRDVITQPEKALEGTKAQPSKEAVARRNRRTRTPIDGRRNILTVKGLAPGMVGRWVDNDPDRVADLMEQGYDLVREKVQVGDLSIDSGKQLGAVQTKRVGGGKEAILMQIPKEWFEADQKAKQKIVDEREAAIQNTGKKSDFYGKVETQDVVPGRRPTRRSAVAED